MLYRKNKKNANVSKSNMARECAERTEICCETMYEYIKLGNYNFKGGSYREKTYRFDSIVDVCAILYE